MKRIWIAIAAALALLWAASATAQEAKVIKSHEDFGDYRVIYSIFNSEFIKPDIAQHYNLVRAKDRAFVNISVVKKKAGGGSHGLAVKVSGSATNLMQQSKSLEFMEIREGDAVYYLAPLRFEHEDNLTFNVEVKLPDDREETVTFRRKLQKN